MGSEAAFSLHTEHGRNIPSSLWRADQSRTIAPTDTLETFVRCQVNRHDNFPCFTREESEAQRRTLTC